MVHVRDCDFSYIVQPLKMESNSDVNRTRVRTKSASVKEP